MEQTIYFMNFKKVYNFHDISIYSRKANGKYVDLTEIEICENNREISLPSNEQYVISFLNTKAANRKCIGKIDLTEMQILANLKSDRFIKQLQRCVEKEEGEKLLALYCAKSIASYNYGKGLLIEEESTEESGLYAFTRHDGHNHHHVVLKKEFRRI